MFFLLLVPRFGLELFDNLCGDIVVEVVENKIRQHIENTSMDNYEESFIQSFENVYYQASLFKFLQKRIRLF